MSNVSHEVLRSSFTCEGTRVFLIHDPEKGLYRLGTRWFWLTAFGQYGMPAMPLTRLSSYLVTSAISPKSSKLKSNECPVIPSGKCGVP